jgi:FkbM family methyltransferase
MADTSLRRANMSIKKSFFKKTARILIKLRISPLFEIRQGGFPLKFYPSSMSRVLWVDQCLSQESYTEEQHFFSRYLCPNDVVVDVGANIGFFTLISSILVGKYGKVYAIEPHPKIYKYLQGNIALNMVENVCTFNVALGSRNGVVKISNDKSDDRTSVVTDDSGVTVPVRRLDQLGIENDSISLLKIDVEGYEKFVIEGAGHVLQKVQCIYFESIERHFLKFGYKLDDLLNVLTNHGFQILEVQGNKVWNISPNCYPKTSKNLVAVREMQAFLKRTSFQLSSEICQASFGLKGENAN